MNTSFEKLPSEVSNWIGRQLFDHVPNNIAVIDRNFNVITANSSFKSVFGDSDGKHCYEIYKSRKTVCDNCMAKKTFKDGKVRVNDEDGIDKDGRPAHYVVHIAPVYDEVGEIAYVIEMSYDLTETKSLQREYNILFERVPCYISVINKNLRVVRANKLLRETFGDMVGEYCFSMYKHRTSKCPDCPALKTFADGGSYNSQQTGIDKFGKKNHYVVSTSPLARSGEGFSHVIEIAVDITEKLENDRLAAVGQTVAQLSHGIKNILTGLRGGMYAIKSGTESGYKERIVKGWSMLDRNMERITVLVKGFLNYSKKHIPMIELTSPLDIAQEIFSLYKASAKKSSVTLILEADKNISKADMDPAGIHTCLANLVSNAIDACEMSNKDKCKVILRLKEQNGSIIYEVEDQGCGMDLDVKEKVLKSFFTTKGLSGTGLGLLVTR